MDIINRLLPSSGPLLTNMRPVSRKKSKPFLKGTLDGYVLLLTDTTPRRGDISIDENNVDGSKDGIHSREGDYAMQMSREIRAREKWEKLPGTKTPVIWKSSRPPDSGCGSPENSGFGGCGCCTGEDPVRAERSRLEERSRTWPILSSGYFGEFETKTFLGDGSVKAIVFLRNGRFRFKDISRAIKSLVGTPGGCRFQLSILYDFTRVRIRGRTVATSGFSGPGQLDIFHFPLFAIHLKKPPIPYRSLQGTTSERSTEILIYLALRTNISIPYSHIGFYYWFDARPLLDARFSIGLILIASPGLALGHD
ncbi:hypothetical protein EAI_02448 [Harpegnathos saltator]|uniref:Uncharacterized protein n=1 Tax=Harpegnathos saltator TaxID=610380 RepID=E2C505_HARSA|nr:hypothetical protein EAI_02448 [Harpegnathos saltator]